jgi:hypothetical protein
MNKKNHFKIKYTQNNFFKKLYKKMLNKQKNNKIHK